MTRRCSKQRVLRFVLWGTLSAQVLPLARSVEEAHGAKLANCIKYVPLAVGSFILLTWYRAYRTTSRHMSPHVAPYVAMRRHTSPRVAVCRRPGPPKMTWSKGGAFLWTILLPPPLRYRAMYTEIQGRFLFSLVFAALLNKASDFCTATGCLRAYFCTAVGISISVFSVRCRNDLLHCPTEKKTHVFFFH